jgi:hypothetical protein
MGAEIYIHLLNWPVICSESVKNRKYPDLFRKAGTQPKEAAARAKHRKTA